MHFLNFQDETNGYQKHKIITIGENPAKYKVEQWDFEALVTYYHTPTPTTNFRPINVKDNNTQVYGFVLVDGDPAVVLCCLTTPFEFLLLEPVDRDTKVAFIVADRLSSPLTILERKPLDKRWLRVDLIIKSETANGYFHTHFTVLYLNNNMRESVINVVDPTSIHNIPNRKSDRDVSITHRTIGYIIIEFITIYKNSLIPGSSGVVYLEPSFFTDDLALVYYDYHKNGKYIYLTLFDKKANTMSTYVVHSPSAMDGACLHHHSHR